MPEADEETQAGGATATPGPGATEATEGGGGVGLPTGAGYNVPRAAPPLRAGDRLEQFVVQGELGAGAMGVVLSAHDPDLDRRVAIKLIRPRPGVAVTEEAQARMLREAQSMAKVTHANVVAVHQVGFAAGRLFIAMEYIDGQTLREWCKERLRSLQEVLAVFRDAGAGLAAAHAAGLVHRDFKPDNVLVSREGRVAVTDFGIVAMAGGGQQGAPDYDRVEEQHMSFSGKSPVLTETGSVLGTPAYMAAEQHYGREVDHRADQFAFCVALWEALYGRRPFHRDTVGALVHATLQGVVDAPPDPPAIRGTVPKPVRRAIERGLRPNPGARWPSMAALLKKLRYDPNAVPRKIAIGAGVVLGIGSLGAAAYWGAQRAEPTCDSGAEHLAEVWSPARRAEVLAAGDGSDGDAGTAVAKRVDEWAEAWGSTYRTVCEAAVVADGEARPLLMARERCLERDRHRMRRALDVFVETEDPRIVPQAVAATTAATSLARCEPVRLTVRGRAMIPEERADEALAIQVEIDAGLLRSWFRSDTTAVDELEDLRPRAEALGDDAVLAELLYETGALLLISPRAADAEATLRSAAAHAKAVDAIAIEAQAIIRVADHAVRFGDPKRALQILGEVEAQVLRGGDSSVRVDYERTMGGALLGTDRAADADKRLAAALELDLAANEERDQSLFHTYSVRALALQRLRRDTEAADAHRRAIALAVKYHGKNHAVVGLLTNRRAEFDRSAGRPREAKAGYERALSIFETSVESQVYAANSYAGLGALALAARDPATATAHQNQALEIRRSYFGPAHPLVASSLNHLGDIYSAVGRPNEAISYWDQARAIYSATYGEQHSIVAELDRTVGRTLFFAGDYAAAQKRFAAALVTLERVLGADDPRLAELFAESGETLEKLGKCDEALPLAKRGRELLSSGGQANSLIDAALLSVQGRCALADGRAAEALVASNTTLRVYEGHPKEVLAIAGELFAKAKALAMLGRGDEARVVATQASNKATAAGPAGKPLVQEVQKWLDTAAGAL